jgi:DNA-binding phage protein
MSITKNDKSTIIERSRKDKKFRDAMLAEAIAELISGDFGAGKAVLRAYINATITFEVLSKFMEKDPRSVARVLSPSGNPRSKSLCRILHAIQKLEKMHFKVIVRC